jgi:hypothetical protein
MYLSTSYHPTTLFHPLECGGLWTQVARLSCTHYKNFNLQVLATTESKDWF